MTTMAELDPKVWRWQCMYCARPLRIPDDPRNRIVDERDLPWCENPDGQWHGVGTLDGLTSQQMDRRWDCGVEIIESLIIQALRKPLPPTDGSGGGCTRDDPDRLATRGERKCDP